MCLLVLLMMLEGLLVLVAPPLPHNDLLVNSLEVAMVKDQQVCDMIKH